VPLAWLVGGTDFAGRRFRVDPGVYVPRRQSEELARRAAVRMGAAGGSRLADLCTGAGAVAASVAASVSEATVVGVDLDRGAAACARANRVPVIVGDLGSALRSSAFDVVTAVAPYVPTASLRLLPADVQRYEPRAALDGGADGLAVVRRVIADASRLLRIGGWLLLELGGDQDTDVAAELGAFGFGEIENWRDEDGDLRGVAARRVVRRAT
jgi:release factor glutamine methyltransferase